MAESSFLSDSSKGWPDPGACFDLAGGAALSVLPYDPILAEGAAWETLSPDEERSARTPRQKKAYWALRLEKSMKKAARRAGMTPREWLDSWRVK